MQIAAAQAAGAKQAGAKQAAQRLVPRRLSVSVGILPNHHVKVEGSVRPEQCVRKHETPLMERALSRAGNQI